MKRVLTYAVVFLGSFIAPVSAHWQAKRPEFDSGFIKMAANGGWCGGLTIIPKSGALVQVIAQRFAEGWFGYYVKPGKVLSKWVNLPTGGLRVAYDWAGPRASYHYRIYCRTFNKYGKWMPVDCSKVVELYDIQHNNLCVSGPVGPSASYAPLNMKTKSKPIYEEDVN